MRSYPRLILLATALVAPALAILLTLTRPSAGPSHPANNGTYDGAQLPADSHAKPFELTDQYGRPVSLGDFAGQVTILAFLNSSCGPSCFLTAQQIRGALDELAGAVPTLIVSTDPGADSSASVKRFLGETSLSGRVQYLTGARSKLESIARSYGAADVSSTVAGEGARTHLRSRPPTFTYVVLIDRQGIPRVGFTVEQLTPEALVHDIRTLESG
jgi:protein SCO1